MSLTRINKTGEPLVIPASDGRLTITVPVQIKRRSGRKVVMLPRGAERPRDGDPTPIQLALARGYRWLAMLESGEVKSLRELARRAGIDANKQVATRIANQLPSEGNSAALREFAWRFVNIIARALVALG
ncbi:MAG: hypothetical protein WA970_24360 [Gammaproteobacteria bacterium]